MVAITTSLIVVTLYHLVLVAVSVGVQKYLLYDKPKGLLYRIIEFPMALPGAVTNIAVPQSVKKKYFNFKPGYLRKVAMCFALNVAIYTVPAYLLFSSR
jgi:hypothetical protein